MTEKPPENTDSKREALQRSNASLQEINAKLVEHNRQLIENALRHEARMAAVLAELSQLRSEHHDLLNAHARAHRQLAAYRTQPLAPNRASGQLQASGQPNNATITTSTNMHPADPLSTRPRPGTSADGMLTDLDGPTLDRMTDPGKPPMDANNIVGGPNEPQLAKERAADRDEAERRAAEILNDPNLTRGGIQPQDRERIARHFANTDGSSKAGPDVRLAGGPCDAPLGTITDTRNEMDPLPYNSDETTNTPDKSSEDR